MALPGRAPGGQDVPLGAQQPAQMRTAGWSLCLHGQAGSKDQNDRKVIFSSRPSTGDGEAATSYTDTEQFLMALSQFILFSSPEPRLLTGAAATSQAAGLGKALPCTEERSRRHQCTVLSPTLFSPLLPIQFRPGSVAVLGAVCKPWG